MSEYDAITRALDDSKPTQSANRSASVTDCRTCGGDRFVTVRLRSPEQTAWMADRGISPPADRFYEEVAPCPSCNPIEVTYWQADGRQFRSMDAHATRKAMAE